MKQINVFQEIGKQKMAAASEIGRVRQRWTRSNGGREEYPKNPKKKSRMRLFNFES